MTSPTNAIGKAMQEWRNNVKRDIENVKDAWGGFLHPGTSGRLTMKPAPQVPPPVGIEEQARTNALRLGLVFLFMAGVLIHAAATTGGQLVSFWLLTAAGGMLIWRGIRLTRLATNGTWVAPAGTKVDGS